MQSLSRQLKRGNAIIIFDSILKCFESIPKRGTSREFWKSSQKFRSEEGESDAIIAAQKAVVGKVGRKKEWATSVRKNVKA